jgi:CMP-N,N'-diacetyllegionaminic acid synthase
VTADPSPLCAWALVPARGGSKSIPYKNLVPLDGVPLLDYGVRAVQASRACARIVGSTEDLRIAARFSALGVEVDPRPTELAGDDTPVADVARDWLLRSQSRGLTLPDIVVLIQPTSPFLLPEHVTALIGAMSRDRDANSGQTIVACPHNAHAWNQRVLEDGRTRFVYAAERRRGYNKQSKPSHFLFGNLVAASTRALLSGHGFFAEPSAAVEIGRPYDFDLDTQADIGLAEAILAAGLVRLPHCKRPAI